MIGEGNGTPLQYSCLENPMDWGAWKTAVHGVAKSRTRRSDFTFTFHFHVLEKETATHSSVLAWRIPGIGEPGGQPSMGSHRVRHDWSNLAAAAAAAMVYTMNTYFSQFRGPGRPRSWPQHIQRLVRAHFLVHTQCVFALSSCGWRDEDISGAFFMKVLITLWPNHLLKAPPPKTVTLELRISTYEF